ncbi:DUF6261 family protein [Maribellus maritimus]|uniref:DUF6261 family protein n=1 Tax=Maribellus maritimus TaxID=2870838 RepID=UPI001EECE49B|nr:DUF6261 family protein [Maribellus maritimus]MCG6188188.1 hypothetical protein [Maribellus maritimus]
MIEKLIYQSRTTEVDAVSERMIGAYQKSDLGGDIHLAKIFSDLQDSSAHLTDAVKQTKAQSELEQQDEIRDNKLRALYYLVNGFLHHPDPAVQNAAKEVKKIVDKYGLAVTGETYSAESSLISSLLGDLAKPLLQSSVAALSGCAELITALQEAQTGFEQTRLDWESEKARESTHRSATDVKNEVVEIINDKLVIYLRAMEMVDAENYSKFARVNAQIISDNNEMVKKRRKKPELTE